MYDRLRLEHGVDASSESTWSRTRQPNDSTNGFCHGERASMKLRSAPVKRHQSGGGGHLGADVHPDAASAIAVGTVAAVALRTVAI